VPPDEPGVVERSQALAGPRFFGMEGGGRPAANRRSAGTGFADSVGEGNVPVVNVRRQFRDDNDILAQEDPLARRARFNVLLTEDRPQAEEHWIGQLPRLLEPQGVLVYVARSGHEAIELAGELTVHAAVIDLGTPRGARSPRGDATGAQRPTEGLPQAQEMMPAGVWLLELFRRMRNSPPTVVLRSPAYSRAEAERLMQEVLRLGAFSVLEKPVQLEQLLSVFRRLLDRQYRGMWPS